MTWGGVQLSLEEIRKIELDILTDVHQYCESNQIRYFLGYGTLLGAIRHNGFIPWDDDIDIIMLRKDYERFIANYNKNEKRKYKVINYKNTERCYFTFSKVIDSSTKLHEFTYSKPEKMADIGVYIDIFPYDVAPQEKRRAVFFHEKYIFPLNVLNTFKYDDLSKRQTKLYKILLYKLGAVISNFCHSDRLLKKIDERAQKFSFLKSDKVANFVFWGYGEKDVFSKRIFDEQISHSFEGHQFYIPREYDEYLKTLYGNYMELPPIEKRVTHHDFEATRIPFEETGF